MQPRVVLAPARLAAFDARRPERRVAARAGGRGSAGTAAARPGLALRGVAHDRGQRSSARSAALPAAPRSSPEGQRSETLLARPSAQRASRKRRSPSRSANASRGKAEHVAVLDQRLDAARRPRRLVGPVRPSGRRETRGRCRPPPRPTACELAKAIGTTLSAHPQPGRRARHRLRAGRCRAAPCSSAWPAASTMPSLTPNFILRGARLATITVSRPTSCFGRVGRGDAAEDGARRAPRRRRASGAAAWSSPRRARRRRCARCAGRPWRSRRCRSSARPARRPAPGCRAAGACERGVGRRLAGGSNSASSCFGSTRCIRWL